MLRQLIENFDSFSLLVIKPKFDYAYMEQLGLLRNSGKIMYETQRTFAKIGLHYSIYDQYTNAVFTLSKLQENKFHKEKLFGNLIMLKGTFISDRDYLEFPESQSIVTPGRNFGKLLDLKSSLAVEEQLYYKEVMNYVEKHKIIIRTKIIHSKIINVEEILKEYIKNRE